VRDRSFAFGDQINLTGITETAVSGRNESYVYTANNRLQEGDGAWGTLTWTYDGVGNRTSEALNAVTNTYSYPSNSNTLSAVTQGATALRSFNYDGAGNVTADNRSGTTYNYTYNNRGRLSELAIDTTVTADYTYDGRERMAIRSTQNMTPAGTTHYVYDTAGHLLMEASGTGTFLTEYIWLDDMPLALVANLDTSPNLYFVHADHLDRPLRMTDTSEAVVWDAIYRPFGDALSITGSATNNLRFPGQYFLIEDGLHYNWYRQYDPTLGRYLQADPLGLVGGTVLRAFASDADAGLYPSVYRAHNPLIGRWLTRDPIGEMSDSVASLYVYVGGQPVNFVDQYGLWRLPDYFSINVNIAITTPWTATLLGWSGTFSVDRYGDWFWSPLGGGVGKPATFVSVSATVNWLDQFCKPSQAQLSNFLTAHGFNATGGFLVGASQSYTPGAGFATGFGFVTPQVGVSYNYSLAGGNLKFSW
jgi:RHS repeat-associated protein